MAEVRSADVVIIGAGIQGLCCAYSLLKLEVKSIVILESADYIGGRASKRSAAMLTRLTGHQTTTDMANRSIRMYHQMQADLAQNAGIDVDFVWCGFALVARGSEAEIAVRAEYDEHRYLNIDTELGTGADLNEATGGIFKFPNDATVCRCATDGYVNIDSLVNALADSIKARGCTILTGVEAVGFEINNDAITTVLTSNGPIATKNVVNAAGIWAGTVARWVDREVIIQPSKKNLIQVVGIGNRFKGPIVECYDDGWYFRPAEGGMLVGVGMGKNVPLRTAQRADPDVDATAIRETQQYLRRWTNLPESSIGTLTAQDGWAGYRPIHARDSESVGRVSAHLPLFGDPGRARGYFESCGWGEFGVTLGPVGGQQVAEEIVRAGNL